MPRPRLTPRLERGAFELPGAEAIKRPLGAKRLLEPAECLCVGAAARRREVRLGEERVDRVGQWRGWSARRPQASNRSPRTHRRECVVLTALW